MKKQKKEKKKKSAFPKVKCKEARPVNIMNKCHLLTVLINGGNKACLLSFLA